MYALHTHSKFNVFALAFVALIATLVFVNWPLSGIFLIGAAVVAALFIIVTVISVFVASRDKITTMSLLPVWVGKPKAANE